MKEGPTFLSSYWGNLVFLCYYVDPKFLKKYLPEGLELDLHNNLAVLSLVAFQFIKTKFANILMPFFHTFSELNLRFYVKRKDKDERGVVFIKEICPYFPVAITARLFFNEKFLVMPSSLQINGNEFNYSFGENILNVEAEGEEDLPKEDSFEHYIVDRYVGFSKWHTGSTLRYYADHEPWKIRTAKIKNLNINFDKIYGNELGECLKSAPSCAIYSKGSEVDLTFAKFLKNGNG